MSYDKTDIDIRDDGIYVKINHNSGNVKNSILRLIQKYGIKDVDYQAIEDALRFKLDEKKISDNTQVASSAEKMDIIISPDKMSVEVVFHEPILRDTMLKYEDMLQMLRNSGVKYGINEQRLVELSRLKQYEVTYVVAEGDPPKPGKNGYIEYKFNTDMKNAKPKVLDDGTVDYKNIDLFQVAAEGDVLAISHPDEKGEDGMNVMGRIVYADKMKKAPPLPKGKNTSIDDEGIRLVADISGRVLYMDNRVSILPVLEIGGNVDNTTGNIDFIGSVIVKGNVVSGFSVIAGADIEVEGIVEGAHLEAVGNILLLKGVQGGGKAYISAGGEINANFIESAVVSAKRNINANSIMHSNLECGGSLSLLGKKGLLVGGKSVVGQKVSAKVIGSFMATSTEIEVGVNPKVMEQYEQLVESIKGLTEQFKKNEQIIALLSKFDLAQLPEDKKKILMEAIRRKIILKKKVSETQEKIEFCKTQLNKTDGVIEASGKIYGGVKATVNNAVLYVQEDISFCRLYNSEGRVQITSCG